MKLSSVIVATSMLFLCSKAYAQQVSDSIPQNVKQLSEVQVTGYFSAQSLQSTPASVSIIDSQQMQFRVLPNLVSVFNSISGVRMEERSPGSYRFSMRGSLLRSPFGVRNVKVYLDEFPLTDGGGNTYLNCIDLTNSSRIELIKGPDGSLFGANTGGVLKLIPAGINEPSQNELSLGGGSYGLFSEQLNTSLQLGKHLIGLQQSYYRSDGYRDNSAMHRANFRLSDKWNYTSKASLKALLFYSDLYYQTPGGLTLDQQDENPRMSRPATATLPSAATQQAAVYTKLLFGGISNEWNINPHLRHVIDIFGSAVDFKNPFITNYETRKENTAGLRTYLEWHDLKPEEAFFKWTLHVGAEGSQTNSDIHNYDNNEGDKGDLQAADNIASYQYFFFTRLRTVFFKRWLLEGSLSRDYAGFRFKDSPSLTDDFPPQWMPRLASSFRVNNHLVLRASVSKGYSTPTTAEARPSDNQFYPDLKPEYGWNYEAGIRTNVLRNRISMSLTVYHYSLQEAIVRHQHIDGTEFFTNAGGTRQTGLESELSYNVLAAETENKVIQGLYVFNNTTWNAFYFHDYQTNDNDYSGNKLTGVPAFVNVLGARCDFTKGFNLSFTYNHTSSIPLNDANNVYAPAYNLLQAMVGKAFQSGKFSFVLNVAVDNILNERYSLGNDINAAGGRYYNPAAARNIMCSLKIMRQAWK